MVLYLFIMVCTYEYNRHKTDSYLNSLRSVQWCEASVTLTLYLLTKQWVKKKKKKPHQVCAWQYVSTKHAILFCTCRAQLESGKTLVFLCYIWGQTYAITQFGRQVPMLWTNLLLSDLNPKYTLASEREISCRFPLWGCNSIHLQMWIPPHHENKNGWAPFSSYWNAETKVYFSISYSSSRFLLYVGTYLPNWTHHNLALLLLFVSLPISLQLHEVYCHI